MTPSIKVRSATPEDVSLIFSFIHKKSEFDRKIGAYSGVLTVSEDKLRQTLFNEHPFAYVLFAQSSEIDLGFALFGFRYSSFIGQPSIWLDDLYVDERFRSKGVGKTLMTHLAQIAQNNTCSHLAWTADARNTRGLSFYHRLGAEIIEKKDNRCFLKWIPESLVNK